MAGSYFASTSCFSQTSGSPIRSMYACIASSLLMPTSLAQWSYLARASRERKPGLSPWTSPTVAWADFWRVVEWIWGEVEVEEKASEREWTESREAALPIAAEKQERKSVAAALFSFSPFSGLFRSLRVLEGGFYDRKIGHFRSSELGAGDARCCARERPSFLGGEVDKPNRGERLLFS